MLRFILRRLLLVIPSLAGLLVMTFFLIRVVPADPAAALAGENATPTQVAEIRRQYGLDQPLYVQFAVYLVQVAHLDFGESAYSRRPVALDIKQRLPATLEARRSQRCSSPRSSASRSAPSPPFITTAGRTRSYVLSPSAELRSQPSGSPSSCS